MKINLLKAQTLVLAVALSAVASFTGCTDKNLYDPNYGKEEIPTPETLPNFSNWSAINLNVDYEMPECETFIEVFAEYPYEEQLDGSMRKTEKLPNFAAYTDGNGKFSGKMQLPAATRTVYLYTPTMGLPRCVELDVTAAGVNFKTADLYESTPQARANAGSPSGKVPYVLDPSKKLYSLCQWSKYGKPSNSGYIKDVSKVVASKWISSIQKTFWGGKDEKPGNLDNRKHLVDEKYTNITIAKELTNNEGEIIKVEDAEITLTFLEESAHYQNTLGYYYYPSDKKPESSDELKKYIIFPNVSTAGSVPFDRGNSQRNAPLKRSSQVTLKYIDEDGKVLDRFPAGYTIGWFLISDAFKSSNSSKRDNDDDDDDDDDDHNTGGKVNTSGTYLYSNESWNDKSKRRCMVLNDSKTERVIVGFEDGGDNSCEDVLFFVESDPRGAILDPEKPEIGDGGEIEKPDKSYETIGTLAFEDNWPEQGDYDMNDVAVTYKRVVSFNTENKVTKLTDTFAAVQREDAAINHNAFAFQVDDKQVGSYTLPAKAIYEPETHSFIVFPNAKLESKAAEEHVVTRTFDKTFGTADLKADNPFIIINYEPGNTNRAEVHLPKMMPTSYADPKLTGSKADEYYVDKDGKHPFAIDLPVINFTLPTEKSSIDSENEYPRFAQWVKDGCRGDSEYADWYLHKK